jgi:hypothetical protein
MDHGTVPGGVQAIRTRRVRLRASSGFAGEGRDMPMPSSCQLLWPDSEPPR